MNTLWGTEKSSILPKFTQPVSGETGVQTRVTESRVPAPMCSTLLPLQGQIPKRIWICAANFCLSGPPLSLFLSLLVESFPVAFLRSSLWCLFVSLHFLSVSRDPPPIRCSIGCGHLVPFSPPSTGGQGKGGFSPHRLMMVWRTISPSCRNIPLPCHDELVFPLTTYLVSYTALYSHTLIILFK